VSNSLTRAWRRYRALPTLPRELATFGIMLAVALTILPLAIWLAGQVFLGDYLRDPAGSRTGGPLALIVDYIAGALHGSPGHWIVLLGPYVLLWALRGVRQLTKN
jgi:hypothetical protein